MCSKKCLFSESPKLPFQFCPKLCPFSYNIGIDKNGSKWTNEKLSVTIFSPEKIFVTITLKMHDFHVSKVSGANGVLDIYRIQPVYNWFGNLLDGFPVHPVHIFVTIFQAIIFGKKLSFQTKYFRWNTDFSKVLFSATQGVFILFHRSKTPRIFK